LRWIVEHGLQLCAQNVLDIEVRLHHLQTVLRSGAPANPHRTTARRGPAPIAERLTK
jgi:hypothetical protein